MLIHLIRHTTPEIDSGICYGQSDLDVCASFASERDHILGKLLLDYDVIYTSPLQRCAKLAAALPCKGNTIEDQRIMEYNFGDWELLPWSEFKSETAQNWMTNFIDQPAPNGENMLQMQARVLAFWQELLTQPFDNVAVVTHSGVQRLIHGHILRTPMSHLFRLKLEFGAVIQINHNDESELLTLAHL